MIDEVERIAISMAEFELGHGIWDSGGFTSSDQTKWRLRARAAIAATDWKSIETAPFGTKPNDHIMVGFQGQFHWISFVAYANGPKTTFPGYALPTHWRPMPTPPEAPAPIPHHGSTTPVVKDSLTTADTTQEKT